MPRPEPTPIDPADLPRLAAATMAAAKFPVLATIDGDRPRARPVSPVRTDGFTVFVANLRAYHKTEEIAINEHVELCYVDDGHNQVRIEGSAEVLTDRPLLEEIWAANPLMRQFLGSLDNPQLVIYRIVPTRVRYMREWALAYFEVAIR